MANPTMPTSSMAMPIGMRSAINNSNTAMPINPIASLRDILRSPLAALLAPAQQPHALDEQHDRIHRRAQRHDKLERIMRPTHHVADPARGGERLVEGEPGNGEEQDSA